MKGDVLFWISISRTRMESFAEVKFLELRLVLLPLASFAFHSCRLFRISEKMVKANGSIPGSGGFN